MKERVEKAMGFTFKVVDVGESRLYTEESLNLTVKIIGGDVDLLRAVLFVEGNLKAEELLSE